MHSRITALTLLALSIPLVVQAELYDDGGSHTLDHATTELVEVRNATRLEVLQGAVVEPVTDTNGLIAVDGSTVILSGGRIEGGTGPTGGRTAIATSDSDVQISDGVVLLGGAGGSGTGGGGGAYIKALSPRSCQIDGGQFLGRDNPAHGGLAASILGNVRISAGEFRAGSGASSGGMGVWLARAVGSIDDAEMAGGDGGTNGGSALLVQNSSLTIHDGTFHGGAGSQSGGSGIAIEDSSVIIRGGDYRAGTADGSNRHSLSAQGYSEIELRGGSYDPGMVLIGDARLFVYGADLEFQNGFLSGILEDGTPIGVWITILFEAEVILVEAVDAEETSFGRIKARY